MYKTNSKTQYPGYRLLVASDSISFLKKIEHFDFTYIIPGIPVHVDYATDNSFELHKKTFIDFLMIANAKKIFLLQTGKMYKSNFPKSASYVNNVPFKLIRF